MSKDYTREIEPELGNDARWLIIKGREMEIKTADAARYFAGLGIDAIIFKGWSLGRYYPNQKPRFYTDVDVSVSATDLKKHGSSINIREAGIPIDVHFEFRHYDKVAWDVLYKRSSVLDLDGVPVRVLSAEDELRIVCAHWLNDGGYNKERLWDIYYLVANRSDDFDWDLCLNSAGENRGRWVACAIKLAAKYLDLDTSELPPSVRDYEIPPWVISMVEREFRTGQRLRPLQQCFNDPKLFWAQLRKRLPPNPIESTIEMDGDLNTRRRAYYQLGSMLMRTMPSLQKSYRFFAAKRS